MVLALPLLTNQSPEEAILARLEELGTNFNQKTDEKKTIFSRLYLPTMKT